MKITETLRKEIAREVKKECQETFRNNVYYETAIMIDSEGDYIITTDREYYEVFGYKQIGFINLYKSDGKPTIKEILKQF